MDPVPASPVWTRFDSGTSLLLTCKAIRDPPFGHWIYTIYRDSFSPGKSKKIWRRPKSIKFSVHLTCNTESSKPRRQSIMKTLYFSVAVLLVSVSEWVYAERLT